MSARCVHTTGANATRFGEPPAYAEALYEIAPGVHAWLVPNGSWGESNAGLIRGESGSLLVDTLWDVPKTQGMLDAMRPVLDGDLPETLVNTHADGDHFWGNQLLPEADSITSDKALAEMQHHKPATMLAFGRLGRVLSFLPLAKARRTGRYFQAMCAPYAFASVTHTPSKRSFSGTLDLDVDGRLVRLIEVGPAHTQGDLIVHVPDAGVVFAGDILFIGSTPVMWAGPVANWLKALDAIQELEAETIVPGHGPLTDKDGVETVRTYWTFMTAAAREHFDAGSSAADAAQRIVTGDSFRDQSFADWDSPERVMTNVHVLYREFSGNTAPMSVVEKIRVMARQAELASMLADATPAAMR